MKDNIFYINFWNTEDVSDETVLNHKITVYPAWLNDSQGGDSVDYQTWLGTTFAIEPNTDDVEYYDEWLWSTYLEDLETEMPASMRTVIETLITRFNAGERNEITLPMRVAINEAFPYVLGADRMHSLVDTAH